jgi:hypothetical protein
VNKIISYSLFKGPDPLAEIFYLRGFYFNCLMNTLVYPDWQTVVHVDRYTFDKYQDLFTHLVANYSIKVQIIDGEYTHCEKMLWRILPVFWKEVEYVICRDADALTSAREAKAVEHWIKSNRVLHGLHDNPGHSIPLMGGMSGFACGFLRDRYGSFDNMIAKAKGPIDQHGTDQHFLNDVVYRDFMCSFWDSGDLGKKTHPSDLCASFIGAAGYNEMETLRFFRSHLPNWGSDQELWKQYPKLFYWHD